MAAEGKPREAQGNVRAFGAALTQFCFSSVGMMVGNKLAMDYLRDADLGVGLPSTLVMVQVIGTLLILVYFHDRIDRDKLNMRVLKTWLPIVTLFAGMLYTSAKTFQYVHVTFVIIVRNVGAIITTIVEYLVRGKQVNTQVIISELSIVFGTVLYGQESALHFKDFWAGMFWCLFNVLCQVLYGVLVKHNMEVDADVAGMSKYTMSLYNNALCLPYLIFVAVASGEPAYFSRILPQVPVLGWMVIMATCAIGFMISTSGFGLQKLVSATTFLVINNMCKILNILLGVIFLGDKLPGVSSFIGCVVSLAGGFWYSWETHRLNEQAKKEAREAATASRAGDWAGKVEAGVAARPGVAKGTVVEA